MNKELKKICYAIYRIKNVCLSATSGVSKRCLSVVASALYKHCYFNMLLLQSRILVEH